MRNARLSSSRPLGCDARSAIIFSPLGVVTLLPCPSRHCCAGRRLAGLPRLGLQQRQQRPGARRACRGERWEGRRGRRDEGQSSIVVGGTSPFLSPNLPWPVALAPDIPNLPRTRAIRPQFVRRRIACRCIAVRRPPSIVAQLNTGGI